MGLRVKVSQLIIAPALAFDKRHKFEQELGCLGHLHSQPLHIALDGIAFSLFMYLSCSPITAAISIYRFFGTIFMHVPKNVKDTRLEDVGIAQCIVKFTYTILCKY